MHPDQHTIGAFEPTIGEQMRLDSFLAGLEKMDREELLQAATMLGQHYFVQHPASVRWLAREAARNLSDSYGAMPSDYGKDACHGKRSPH